MGQLVAHFYVIYNVYLFIGMIEQPVDPKSNNVRTFVDLKLNIAEAYVDLKENVVETSVD